MEITTEQPTQGWQEEYSFGRKKICAKKERQIEYGTYGQQQTMWGLLYDTYEHQDSLVTFDIWKILFHEYLEFKDNSNF